jgi:hypothetical protein
MLIIVDIVDKPVEYCYCRLLFVDNFNEQYTVKAGEE